MFDHTEVIIALDPNTLQNRIDESIARHDHCNAISIVFAVGERGLYAIILYARRD